MAGEPRRSPILRELTTPRDIGFGNWGEISAALNPALQATGRVLNTPTRNSAQAQQRQIDELGAIFAPYMPQRAVQPPLPLARSHPGSPSVTVDLPAFQPHSSFGRSVTVDLPQARAQRPLPLIEPDQEVVVTAPRAGPQASNRKTPAQAQDGLGAELAAQYLPTLRVAGNIEREVRDAAAKGNYGQAAGRTMSAAPIIAGHAVTNAARPLGQVVSGAMRGTAGFLGGIFGLPDSAIYGDASTPAQFAVDQPAAARAAAPSQARTAALAMLDATGLMQHMDEADQARARGNPEAFLARVAQRAAQPAQSTAKAAPSGLDVRNIDSWTGVPLSAVSTLSQAYNDVTPASSAPREVDPYKAAAERVLNTRTMAFNDHLAQIEAQAAAGKLSEQDAYAAKQAEHNRYFDWLERFHLKTPPELIPGGVAGDGSN